MFWGRFDAVERFAGAQAQRQALVGLLARLGGTGAPAVPSLPSRLAAWIDWPQAVALSAALETRPLAHSGSAPSHEPDDEGARVHAAVVGAIEADRAFAGTDAADAAFFRQRYIALQRVMEGEVGLSRKRLRERIARDAPHLGRLAALDAVMERALGTRERSVLAALPDVLAVHFQRLQPSPDDPPPSPAGRATAWLDTFRRDMKCLLLAELDFRLQPARGLGAALRATPPDRHE